MSNIVIRKILPEEAEKLIEYTRIIGSETDNLTYGSEGINCSINEETNFIEKINSSNKSIMICAFENDKIVGCANLVKFERRMSHRGEIGISVLKEYWGNNIGSMLMKKIIEFAKESGIEIINLEVRKDNERAIKLYEKYNFKHIGISPAFFKIDNEYIDFELMYLDLR